MRDRNDRQWGFLSAMIAPPAAPKKIQRNLGLLSFPRVCECRQELNRPASRSSLIRILGTSLAGFALHGTSYAQHFLYIHTTHTVPEIFKSVAYTYRGEIGTVVLCQQVRRPKIRPEQGAPATGEYVSKYRCREFHLFYLSGLAPM